MINMHLEVRREAMRDGADLGMRLESFFAFGTKILSERVTAYAVYRKKFVEDVTNFLYFHPGLIRKKYLG